MRHAALRRWAGLSALVWLAALPLALPSAATAASPPAPPGCVSTTATASNATPVPILSNATSISTIVVSGATGGLSDLDVVTAIKHTFPADLDVTLTSPAGTVVTLTTDNGGANVNVFDGTVWDDDADPAGAVPYSSNNGLVTDHTYANLTLASPLVPEESLGAFIGENPNGTWTLTISDDVTGQDGTLTQWGMTYATTGARVVTSVVATQNAPTAIPAGPDVVTSTLVVAGAGSHIGDVNLTTSLTHTRPADLDVTLTSPAGTVVTLTTDNGGDSDNVFDGTVWDDDADPAGAVPYSSNNGLVTDHTYANLTLASPLVPEESLGAFIGENPNGTWTLTISDDQAVDGGTLSGWSLQIATELCRVDLETTITDTPDPLGVRANLTYGVSVTNKGPGDAAGTSVSVPLDAKVNFAKATPSGVDASCTTPRVGSSGTVKCAWIGPVPPTGSRTVSIVVTTTVPGSLSTTATAATDTPEVTTANNAATAATTVSRRTAENGQFCTVVGTGRPDVLTGTNAADVICGLGGDDRITNKGPRDVIDGGSGNDTIRVRGNLAIVFGGPGHDQLTGHSGPDRLVGGAGKDVMGGGAGNDVLSGGLDNDRISGGPGNDRISGGAGTDLIRGDAGEDRLNGGAGRDRLTGGSDKDVVNGAAGVDTSFGTDTLISVEIRR